MPSASSEPTPPPSPSPLTALIRLAMRWFQRMPLDRAYAIGRGIGLLWFHLVPVRRRIAMDNLRKAFRDEKSEAELRDIARNNFIHYGMGLAEFLRFPLLSKADIGRSLQFTGTEHLESALAAGKGVIILCGHYGNWDMLVVGQAMLGYGAHIITKRAHNSTLDRFWMTMRESKGVRFLPNHQSSLAILKLLKRNGILGIAFDQHRPDGIPTTFFGRPVKTMRAVAFLALKTGCAVIPATTWRDDAHVHHVRIHPALPLLPADTEDQAVRLNTQAYNDVIESFVRQHPEQWLWIHRRWK